MNFMSKYTFRMQEQDNIWESYQIILQRLRNFVDAPYEARPDGVGAGDESQLYALREGLTNAILCKCLHKKSLTRGSLAFSSSPTSSLLLRQLSVLWVMMQRSPFIVFCIAGQLSPLLPLAGIPSP